MAYPYVKQYNGEDYSLSESITKQGQALSVPQLLAKYGFLPKPDSEEFEFSQREADGNADSILDSATDFDGDLIDPLIDVGVADAEIKDFKENLHQIQESKNKKVSSAAKSAEPAKDAGANTPADAGLEG